LYSRSSRALVSASFFLGVRSCRKAIQGPELPKTGSHTNTTTRSPWTRSHGCSPGALRGTLEEGLTAIPPSVDHLQEFSSELLNMWSPTTDSQVAITTFSFTFGLSLGAPYNPPELCQGSLLCCATRISACARRYI
jgi:hypothetical protein